MLLKAHDDTGFTFYTNRTSRKGRYLAVNPGCCAVFPWYALGRQVTVEGSARPLSWLLRATCVTADEPGRRAA